MRLRFAKALVGVLVLGLGAASAEPAPAGQAAAAPRSKAFDSRMSSTCRRVRPSSTRC